MGSAGLNVKVGALLISPRRSITDSCALVDISMTFHAKSDQILLRVVTGLAAKFLVVHLKIRHQATALASPTVSTQYLQAQGFVQLGSKPLRRILWSNPVHDAFSRAWATNAFCCSAGRNLKQREIEWKSRSGHPLSRFAPARKSAQIISRQ
jgi:hypothetical protein